MKEEENNVENIFLTQGKGVYYLNIVCTDPNKNRSYKIPRRIIEQSRKVKQMLSMKEEWGNESVSVPL